MSRMGKWPLHPLVYEINTAVWLTSLSRTYGRPISLGGIPQTELERLAELRFDGVWLMGVWQRSAASRTIARAEPALLGEYRRALPDVRPDDIIGSPYAIADYTVDPLFGGDQELAALRQRLRALNLRLVLDFVPNHLARDHAWVGARPEFLVQGTAAELQARPNDYFEAGGRVFAHGRDPNFAPWTDTVQVDYRCAAARRAMTHLLVALSERCDGLRCDMAMLVTADVFCRTWGGRFDPPGADFWPDAIRGIKRAHPGFLMLAEVYWDLEYDLQQQGFDFTYDKRLYDRFQRRDDPEAVRRHLFADIEFQRRLARFVENHDEPRAAAQFGPEGSKAVAALAVTLPGLRLLHQGQLDGFETRWPVQLRRAAPEPTNTDLQAFYQRLLNAVDSAVFHEGSWKLLEARAAWSGNRSCWNAVAHRWVKGEEFVLAVSNLSPDPMQCYVPLELPALSGCTWELRDLLSEARYDREGDGLLHPGLYLDMPAYGRHVFAFA